jgi:hypothetical protein
MALTYQNRQNMKINKYVNKMKTQQMVENEEIATALNKIYNNIQHVSVEEINNKNYMASKDSEVKSKEIPVPNPLNPHIISHHVRKESEQVSLASQINLKTYTIHPKLKVFDEIKEADEQEEDDVDDDQGAVNQTEIDDIKYNIKQIPPRNDDANGDDVELPDENDYNYDELEYQKYTKMLLREDYKDKLMRQKDQQNKKLQKEHEQKQKEFDEIELQVPTRPIIDINSSRLIQSNLVDTILIPEIDSADADRIRQIDELIDQQYENLKKQHKLFKNNYKDDEWNQQRIQRRQQTFQQFFSNFGSYIPRYNNKASQSLVLATDVLYYISDEDIYQAAEWLDNGTFMIGHLHIPKTLETKEQLIVYAGKDKEFVEGKLTILPNDASYTKKYYDIDEVEMMMEMDGNDHTYNHKIRFPELATRRFTVLIPEVERNFIIKAVVDKRVDTGATYYTTVKFIKIRNPKYTDYIDIQEMENKEDLSYFKTAFNQAMQQDQYPSIVYFNSAINRSKCRVVNTLYQKYIETETIIQGQKVISLQPNPEYKDFITEDPQAVVQQYGPEYYIVRNKTGKSINTTILYRQSIKKIKEQINIEKVDPQLLNKINTKIALASKIDAAFIRALLNFINRENDKMPIDSALSLITHSLVQVSTIEAQISLLKDSGLSDMINCLKSDQVSKVPNSIWQSFISGNIFRYLKIKLANEWLSSIHGIFSDRTGANLEKASSHFC